jgi:valyl-tRNA synthetase
LISGWGLAGEGMGKISKSRGGGPMSPMEMIERYSADAVRYWAASTGPGKDALISEEKIQMGTRLVNKIWNVARFSERFLAGFVPSEGNNTFGRDLTPADRWILASLQRLIRRTTDLLEHLDYAAAKSEVEDFFWNDLADNYLEMCKQRLYDEGNPWRDSARFSLYQVLLNTLKLLAPFLPYVTEEIYLNIYRDPKGKGESIHTTAWPYVDVELDDPQALAYGQMLVEIATAVRRYKSEHNLPLGYELKRVQLAFASEHLEWEGTNPVGKLELLKAAIPDLTSITRAHQIEVLPVLEGEFQMIGKDSNIYLAIEA